MKAWVIIGLCIKFVTYSTSTSLYEQSPCTTFNNEPGVCINIQNCPQLQELIYEVHADQESLYSSYRSNCSSPIKSYICCSLKSQKNCGRAPLSTGVQRIVGGDDSEYGQWPWVVLIGFRTKTHWGPFWMCGGSAISATYILTAAHCFDDAGLIPSFVRFGESDMLDDQRPFPIDIRIDSYIIHKNYQDALKLNDIALVRLKEPINFSDFIQPICLPEFPGMKTDNFYYQRPFIAGWGQTSTDGDTSPKLKHTQVPILPNKLCDDAYRPHGFPIIDRQICAGYLLGGKDACQGDSGGPLMLPVQNTYYAIGIISFGFECARPGFPGIYTRVTSYIDWIKSVIE